MGSTLVAMASTLVAMASNLLAMNSQSNCPVGPHRSIVLRSLLAHPRGLRSFSDDIVFLHLTMAFLADECLVPPGMGSWNGGGRNGQINAGERKVL